MCGDFQAVRNQADLATMACPAKYRSMQGFYRYYSGEKLAPVLTIFIGGNHEASNHLWELYYGGWVAPNIYFLGYGGVVNVGGVRIGGVSGIYNGRHYNLGHYECPPYDDSDMRSAYHVRQLEAFRLSQLRKPLDIFLSHDWPQHIARYGDTGALLRKKSFLRDEVYNGSLGSPPNAMLLNQLQPSYWFSAHLHVKFAALILHEKKTSNVQQASLNSGGADVPRAVRATRFLSLDKCLPNRDFLQIVRVDGDSSPPILKYDAEWIAVLRSTAHLFSSSRSQLALDSQAIAGCSRGRTDFTPTLAELQAVLDAVQGDLAVPLNFCITAPAYQPGQPAAGQSRFVENPQTAAFVQRFGLPQKWREQKHMAASTRLHPSHPLLGPKSASVPMVDGACSHSMFSPMPGQIEMDEEIDIDDV